MIYQVRCAEFEKEESVLIESPTVFEAAENMAWTYLGKSNYSVVVITLIDTLGNKWSFKCQNKIQLTAIAGNTPIEIPKSKFNNQQSAEDFMRGMA